MRLAPALALVAPLAWILGCGAEDPGRSTVPVNAATVAPPVSVAVTAPPPLPPPPPPPPPDPRAAPDGPPRMTVNCVRPTGTALPVKLADASVLKRAGSFPRMVLTSAAQLQKLARVEPPPEVDFARERMVHVPLRGDTGSKVTWIVETAQEIVIGVDVPAYCGGATPPNVAVDVVLPAHGKPVRVDECYLGQCGLPLP